MANTGGLIRFKDLYKRVKDEENKTRLKNLITGKFEKVKKGSKDSTTFLKPTEAERVESIIINLENLSDLMPLSEAAKEVDTGLNRLRRLISEYGTKHLLTKTIDEKLEIGYERSSARDYPIPIIPYVQWFEDTNRLLTKDVVLTLETAMKKLELLKQNKKDNYFSYRLAEIFLMEYAYSPNDISKELNLPLEFVLEKMDNFYREKRFKKSLWKGLINPYYIEAVQFTNLAKELKKIYAKEQRRQRKLENSYSAIEIEGIFNLDRRLVKKILKNVERKYKGVFKDKEYGLCASKDIVDEIPDKILPLRQLLLTEQRIRQEKEKLFCASDLSSYFHINQDQTGRRLKWLYRDGYKEQIISSYLGRLFIPLELKEDNFVASIFSEEKRKEHYYTDMEIKEKFPYLSSYRIKAILKTFQQERDYKDKIYKAFAKKIFVEKELIDKRSSLYQYLERQNKVMESKSDYITVRKLEKYSNITARGLRFKLEGLPTKYKSSMILLGNTLYVEIKKLHKYPYLREQLHIETKNLELLRRREDQILVAIIRKKKSKSFFGFITQDKPVYNELTGLIYDDMSLYRYGLTKRPTTQTKDGLYVAVTQIVDPNSLIEGSKKNELEQELIKRGYTPVYLKLIYAEDQQNSLEVKALERVCMELMYEELRR